MTFQQRVTSELQIHVNVTNACYFLHYSEVVQFCKYDVLAILCEEIKICPLDNLNVVNELKLFVPQKTSPLSIAVFKRLLVTLKKCEYSNDWRFAAPLVKITRLSIIDVCAVDVSQAVIDVHQLIELKQKANSKERAVQTVQLWKRISTRNCNAGPCAMALFEFSKSVRAASHLLGRLV
jgi:hypothetical protein